MLLALRISSYGCTWEVWRALKKLGERASITRYMHAKYERILKYHGREFKTFIKKQKRNISVFGSTLCCIFFLTVPS